MGDVKKGVNAVWVGILAVFAAPIALPILLVALILVMVLAITVVLIFVALMACAVAIALEGPVSLWGGFAVLTKNIPVALICFGRGLIGIGLGLLLIRGLYLLMQKLMNWLIRLFGNMVKKGGKTDA